MTKQFQLFKNARGLSLIEVMVALGVGSIILMAITSMMSLMNKGNLQQTVVQARNEVIIKIRNQAMNFDNLKVSAIMTKAMGATGMTPDIESVNNIARYDMLAKCMPEISDVSAIGCDKNAMDELTKGNQFYLAGSLSQNPNDAIAGEDIYYRSNGTRCTQADAADPTGCPIYARVWFEPYCLNYAKSCNKAMSLAVRYSVGVRPGSALSAVGGLEGEVYIPVQKGIQLSRLLNENDVPISSNSFGIFSVQKYYGSQPAAGLRFEAVVSNPMGLVRLKMQKRSLEGPEAKPYGENVVPTALEGKPWVDIPTPGNAAMGAWAINLNNARPNQFFNFGTQTTVAVNSRPPTSFGIGSADPNNSTYRWTKNGLGQFQAPVFKSGLYQFRIVAEDSAGNWIESTNYFTVRIIGRPEILFDNPVFSQNRNCASPSFSYNVLVGDDEYISENKVELDGVNLGIANIADTHGNFSIPFDLSKVAKSYSLKVTLKNPLSDVSLEGFVVPSYVDTKTIILSDVPASFSALANNPSKIRINTDGTVSVTYTTGSCCTETPSVDWLYPNPAAFGSEPLLSGDASSNLGCATSGNTRVCTSSVLVRGIKEGPLTGVPPADIQGTLKFSGVPPAECKLPTSSSYTQSKYVPVVKNPTISFYLTESLWLNIPGSNIKTKTPRVVVRSDFAPMETVKVQVVKATDNSVVCDVEFLGSATPGTPIDKFCNIPTGFSGDLVIQKHPDYNLKIQSDSDPTTVDQRARITGSLVHRTCNATLTDVAGQSATYTVPATLPMNDSPWGTAVAPNPAYPNDSGVWTAGANKTLRCYDSWTSYSDTRNIQDYYELYKYNTETRLASALVPIPGPQHQSIGDIASPIAYQNFIFPANPPLLVDPTSKNIPYIYAVYQDGGSPGTLIWQYKEGSLGAAQTRPEGWEDVTSQVCAGTGTLSKTKLWRSQMSIASNSSNIIMKATNRVYSTLQYTTHSYMFMCQYGRWHPSGSGAVNWVD